MNSNLAKVGKPTRWPPGKSSNLAGKPPGTRTAFSQGFIRDFALVWAEEGSEAVRKVAKRVPEAFVSAVHLASSLGHEVSRSAGSIAIKEHSAKGGPRPWPDQVPADTRRQHRSAQRRQHWENGVVVVISGRFSDVSLLRIDHRLVRLSFQGRRV